MTLPSIPDAATSPEPLAPAPSSAREAPTVAGQRQRYARPRPSLLWRLYLRAGPGGARELQRWAFWSWWVGIAAARGRWEPVRATLKRPLAILREACAAVRRHGPKTARVWGVSERRQLLEVLTLWARYQVWPSTYYTLQLFRPERRRVAGAFLHERQSVSLMYTCSFSGTERGLYGPLLDKSVFERWCAAHALPSVATCCVVDGDAVTDGDAAAIPAADLFTKPTNARAGIGAMRWTYADGRHHDRDGTPHTRAELLAALHAQSVALDRPIAVQRCLANHAATRGLTSGGLCTVRIVTAHRGAPPYAGPPEIVVGAYRMPTGGAPADNFDTGGLASAVDLATGTLGPAVQKRGDFPVDVVEVHPDTGVRVVGHVLPHWADACALVQRAH